MDGHWGLGRVAVVHSQCWFQAGHGVQMCVCVCVCVRQRHTQGSDHTHTHTHSQLVSWNMSQHAPRYNSTVQYSERSQTPHWPSIDRPGQRWPRSGPSALRLLNPIPASVSLQFSGRFIYFPETGDGWDKEKTGGTEKWREKEQKRQK